MGLFLHFLGLLLPRAGGAEFPTIASVENAAPRRSGAGSYAKLQQCWAIASAGCTGPVGPPKGNRNALKQGEFSAETLALKREIQALSRMARKTMAAIE